MSATDPGSHAGGDVPGASAAVSGSGPAPGDGRAVVGVLAVQGDVREHVDVLGRLGVEVVLVRRPQELDRVDALVLPGGESTAIDRLVRAFDLQGPLRARVAAGMPVLGSCAGMILLADRLTEHAAGQQTVGGIDMTVRRNGFGRQVDSFETDLAVTGLPGPPVHAVFIRAPVVVEVGAGVEVLARVPHPGPHGAVPAPGGTGDTIVAVRQGALLATAFHPEVSGDDRFHRLLVGLAEQARGRSGAP